MLVLHRARRRLRVRELCILDLCVFELPVLRFCALESCVVESCALITGADIVHLNGLHRSVFDTRSNDVTGTAPLAIGNLGGRVGAHVQPFWGPSKTGRPPIALDLPINGC